jgi:hypothetical protein
VQVTTPYDGKVKYTFGELWYEQRLPGGEIEMRDSTVVTAREAIDRGDDDGIGEVWQYAYSPLVADLSSLVTTMTAPDGTVTTFDYRSPELKGDVPTC